MSDFVVEGSAPQQRVVDGVVFPLVLVPKDPSNNSAAALTEWIAGWVCCWCGVMREVNGDVIKLLFVELFCRMND